MSTPLSYNNRRQIYVANTGINYNTLDISNIGYLEMPLVLTSIINVTNNVAGAPLVLPDTYFNTLNFIDYNAGVSNITATVTTYLSTQNNTASAHLILVDAALNVYENLQVSTVNLATLTLVQSVVEFNLLPATNYHFELYTTNALVQAASQLIQINIKIS